MAIIYASVNGQTVVVTNNDLVEVDIPGGGEITVAASPLVPTNKLRVRFKNDDEADTVNVDLSTFAVDNLQVDIFQYDPSDTLNLLGAYDRYVDPDDPGIYRFSYTGSDGETYSAFINAKDGGEKDFDAPLPPIIICFGRGTRIATPKGERAVQDLRPGDLVETQDSGPAPLRWIGRRRLNRAELAAAPNLRPIRLQPSALGPGLPARALVLSPNHCVLLSGWQAEIMFGEREVLVPIKALVNDTTITVAHDIEEVEYFHLLLDRHEVLLAEGLGAESLFLGRQARRAVSPAGLAEIEALFGSDTDGLQGPDTTARPVLRAREAMLLVA